MPTLTIDGKQIEVPDGTNDCDSDGTNDLPLKAYSEAETSGEFVYANYVSGSMFKAELPVSALYDVDPGVLRSRQSDGVRLLHGQRRRHGPDLQERRRP